MDRNTKILAAVLGACVVYALYTSVAQPLWIEPLFTMDDRIAERTKELEKLEAREDEVHRAKLEYRDLLDRMGSFDDVNVRNNVRERINELVARYKLEGARTTRMTADAHRKTNVVTMRGTTTAVGTLESAIGFLRDVYELPHVLQVGNVTISPAGSSRKSKKRHKKEERVTIRVPIEVRVLPQQRILNERLRDEDLNQPEAIVRHEDRDYSAIYAGTRFTEFIPLKPLVVEAGPDVDVQMGRRAHLNGGAKGGDGLYTFAWVPPDGLVDATSPKTKIDTDQPGTVTYTLTVKDESGNSGEDTATVTVKEKAQPKIEPKVAKADPVPEPPPKTKRWKDRKNMQLSMTLMRTEADSRVHEVMVYDRKSKDTTYFPVQAEFDGGTLVGVHPRGGVVRRDEGGNDAYYVYPIGEKLDKEISVDDAGDYPVLQNFAFRVRDAELEALAAQEADGDDEGDAAVAGPDGKEAEPAGAVESQSGQPHPDEDAAAPAKSGAGEEEARPVGKTDDSEAALSKQDRKALGRTPPPAQSGAKPSVSKTRERSPRGRPVGGKAEPKPETVMEAKLRRRKMRGAAPKGKRRGYKAGKQRKPKARGNEPRNTEP